MFLQIVWFFLWGLLWAIFFMTDGFDFGIGIIYPFLGKSESDKRTIMRSIGPFWDGNEVWLITAGGVTFAAFPLFYSVMFSTLYSPLMLILFALILRGVSFEFRSKMKNKIWKKIWDSSIFVSSIIPAFLFGVVFANIFKGLPIDQNNIYHGNIITLLNPYSILGGILFLCLFITHGALWLTLKSAGALQIRSEEMVFKIWPILCGCSILFLMTTAVSTNLYNNYIKYPILFMIIFAIILTIWSIRYFLVRKMYLKAWLSSAGAIVSSVFFGFVGLFPNLFKSSINDEYNLTVFNSSSSPMTLKIMLVIVIFFIPIVLGYQFWVFNFFKEKITDKDLINGDTY